MQLQQRWYGVMKHSYQYAPINRELYLKITVLKSMMYCGVVWGLYHQGWAMMRDQEDHVFPFWLNPTQARKYAEKHWPHYQPRKITPQDFKESLLPTLSRLKVKPALCYPNFKLKLNQHMMRALFFQDCPAAA